MTEERTIEYKYNIRFETTQKCINPIVTTRSDNFEQCCIDADKLLDRAREIIVKKGLPCGPLEELKK